MAQPTTRRLQASTTTARYKDYCVDRAFVSMCVTPCLVLAGNDEAHPFPISEDLAKLLPHCEFIKEWKTGAPLASARTRVKEFVAEHTPLNRA
jgi:hypothetical protein